MLKFTATLSLAAISALALSANAHAKGGEGWVTDFAKAKQTAAKEKKDLLIDFTGSDWCGWCIKLREEVFDLDAFKKEAPKHFVLVELDYPRNKSGMSKELLAQNERLKNEYAITGYPTIWLTDAEGRPYAKTGYQRGGAEKYLEHLAELRQKREERDKYMAAVAKVDDSAEKAKLLDKALGALPSEALPFYKKVIGQIIEHAGEDSELTAKYEKMLAEFAMQAKVAAIETEFGKHASAQEWDKAAAVVEKAMKAEKLEDAKGEAVQKLWYLRGLATIRGGDREKGMQLLRKCVEAAPNSRMGRGLAKQLESMGGK
jgi:thioredoxin-related protein